MTNSQPITYAELQPGEKFNPNSREWFFARTVKSVSEAYQVGNVTVVAVECTDGYAAEVLADIPAKPQPVR